MNKNLDCAFDLDGVIALLNFDNNHPTCQKSWSKKNGEERRAYKEYVKSLYKVAKFGLDPRNIVDPMKPIIIITARKADEDVMRITMNWLKEQGLDKHPGGLRCHFLDKGRTVKNVIEFKSKWLKEYGIGEFFEDNKKVLQGISEHVPGINLNYVAKDLSVHPINFEIA